MSPRRHLQVRSAPSHPMALIYRPFKRPPAVKPPPTAPAGRPPPPLWHASKRHRFQQRCHSPAHACMAHACALPPHNSSPSQENMAAKPRDATRGRCSYDEAALSLRPCSCFSGSYAECAAAFGASSSKMFTASPDSMAPVQRPGVSDKERGLCSSARRRTHRDKHGRGRKADQDGPAAHKHPTRRSPQCIHCPALQGDLCAQLPRSCTRTHASSRAAQPTWFGTFNVCAPEHRPDPGPNAPAYRIMLPTPAPTTPPTMHGSRAAPMATPAPGMMVLWVCIRGACAADTGWGNVEPGVHRAGGNGTVPQKLLSRLPHSFPACLSWQSARRAALSPCGVIDLCFTTEEH